MRVRQHAIMCDNLDQLIDATSGKLLLLRKRYGFGHPIRGRAISIRASGSNEQGRFKTNSFSLGPSQTYRLALAFQMQAREL